MIQRGLREIVFSVLLLYSESFHSDHKTLEGIHMPSCISFAGSNETSNWKNLQLSELALL